MEQWAYEIIPLLWAASVDGHEGVNGSLVAVEEDFDDIIEFVDVGGAMRIEARRAPIGWFGEVSYVVLSDNVATPAGGVRAELTQWYGEGGLSFDINEQLLAYGALRFQGLEIELTSTSGQLQGDKNWVDVVAGLRWTPVRSDRWIAWLRGDVGAGGSDLVWLAEGGVGYGFGSRWRAYLGYRLLSTDYESDGFLYDIDQSGFALGVGFRF